MALFLSDREIRDTRKNRKTGGTKMNKPNKAYKTQPTKASDAATQIADAAGPAIAKATEELAKKRRLMTIDETKLGVTLVVTKTECETLGIKGNVMTREAIRIIREKLGLEK
jgi:hypothetical protein